MNYPELTEATPDEVRDLCISLMVERGRLLDRLADANGATESDVSPPRRPEDGREGKDAVGAAGEVWRSLNDATKGEFPVPGWAQRAASEVWMSDNGWNEGMVRTAFGRLLVSTRRRALEEASHAVPEIAGEPAVADIIRRGILALREKEPA